MAKGLELFKARVRPILESSCLRCHGGKAVESEFDLADRAGLLRGGQAGPAVVVGKSQDSLLVKLIRHQRDPHMPRVGGPLSPEAVDAIAKWIDLGAPYDNPLVASRAKAKSWTEREVPAEAREFWSYQPLRKSVPPAVRDAGWARTPVDHFILAKLEAAGLTPNALAPPEVLLRRLSFGLTGLPPTPEELDDFVKAAQVDRTQAVSQAIDRLLANPHYGERWARHWLDLARFAESHGFEHDTDRPTAYQYRDFVIEAFNRDLPYTTFARWQIAGDEYEPDNPLAVKATGFLAAGVHSTQITKNEVEKHRYDELDDKLSTLSTAFLGLTLGCARCHDHKYDALPQRDYYRMLSTFTTTVRSEVGFEVDGASYAKAKAAFDSAHAPLLAALSRFEQQSLPLRFNAWLEQPGEWSAPWEFAAVKESKAKSGATLTPQADCSILASGKSAKTDMYTVNLGTSLRRLTGFRLEALPHPSLPKDGPGRAANGDFALSDLTVTILARDTDPRAIKLVHPEATHQNSGGRVRLCVDSDPKTAWSITPHAGAASVATFEFEEPVDLPPEATVKVLLQFQAKEGFGLGRFRLALTDDEVRPDALAPGGPAEVLEALRSEARSAAQLRALQAWYKTQDALWQRLDWARLKHEQTAPKPNLVKALVATEGLPAVRLNSQGEDFLRETHFLRRGDPENREGVATQGFLQVLTRAPELEKRWQAPPPAGWRTSYRRRALAEWLTDPEYGAGHLLARVIVNRLWQHHFGRGLVATPSDFGTRGEPPTHPELLDYLAQQLIDSGWSLKALHKRILTSATYQQASGTDEARRKLDPDNKLVWHHPSRRLEAEVIRDAVLAVSGQLDSRLFGPGTLDPQSKRRSIYFTVKRSKLMPMMVIFDAPEALSGMAERPTTTIAPQALHMLNNPQMREAARALARRAAPSQDTSLADTVRTTYLLALARRPNERELQDSVAFIEQQQASYAGPGSRESALADFCQVVLCLNEFVYID